MADGRTWWLAEIYKVRHSKYFEESDEDEEGSETWVEEIRDADGQMEQGGEAILFKEYLDMHDVSVMHPCWQEQDAKVSLKERDNVQRAREFNQSYFENVGKHVVSINANRMKERAE